MSYKKKFLIYLFSILLNFNYLHSLENKILLRINNEIITTIDIYNEKNYLIAFNNDIENLEENKILEIAKTSLVKEKIITNEILKYTDKLLIEDKYLNQFIKQLYNNQNLDNLESFIEYLNNYNVSFEYLKKKISIEIIWNDLIVAKFSDKIKIDINKIRNELNKDIYKKSKEYFLSEIIFNNNINEKINEKIKIIEKDINQLGFKNAALIHSISNSVSKNNGEIGWINENSLSLNIKNILNKLDKGNHTEPIIVPGGFLILKIDNIRIVENKDFDIDEKLEQIVKAKKNEQLNNYSNIYYSKIKKEYFINENL